MMKENLFENISVLINELKDSCNGRLEAATTISNFFGQRNFILLVMFVATMIKSRALGKLTVLQE